MKRAPLIRTARLREEGVPCACCTVEIERGQETVACEDCGAVHHWACWQAANGCSNFSCASAVALPSVADDGPIRITVSDLEQAQPLPPSRPPSMGPAVAIGVGPDPEASRWNRLAGASLIIAVVGIPLYGIVTGLLAVAVGALSLVGRNSFRRRGLSFAAAGIVLGIADFVGWSVYLAGTGNPANVAFALEEFEPDPTALEGLPSAINRAMKANVLIRTGNLLQQGIGSGVILRIQNGEALVLTNRHVIDPAFADGGGSVMENISDFAVKGIGQPSVTGSVIWLAPDDVDLAVITMPVVSTELLAAAWDAAPNVQVGDEVFAIGSPHGLGWTYTEGRVSQIRRQKKKNSDYGVIQTSAAINPGNSGGGLFDGKGRLVGINTWTQDKRVAEGLGFAIVFHTLYELLNGELELPERHIPMETP
ncbi:MAG: trypsin-like peptidase domain-containing protein [Planctomycetaceae bacterium]